MSERMGAETTMTVGWIAERMAMGTRGYLNHLLCRRRQLDGDCTKSRTDPFSARTKRPAWLRVDRLLGEWCIPKDSPAGR